MYEELRTDHKISIFDLFKQLEDDTLIPISIFTKELAALETICKYLKENLGFSNKKIASLTGRNSKDIWQAYDSATKKLSKKFDVKTSKYFIPVSILKNKNLSVLENIVACLKEKFSLSYHEIAVLLKRDDRTVWTVYQNSLKKNVKR